jgi:hypothetical protein
VTIQSPAEFYTVPTVVEAWKLTEDNLPLVAKWCNGRVKGLSITFPKIRDKSKTLESTDTNSYAVLGDYIVRVSNGFKVVKGVDFERGHREATRRISNN